MSDQVPFGVTQVAQSIRLCRKLLHPVLAEDAQPGGVRLADVCGWKSLADAHQCDFIRSAGRAACSCCDPLPHLGNIFCNRHKTLKAVTANPVLIMRRGPSFARLDPSTSLRAGSRGRPSLRGSWWRPDGRGRPSLHERHMIAVGGAGSSGLPALASGTRIMTIASTASAPSASRNGGVHWTSVTSWPEPTRAAMSRPHSASPAIRPEAVRTPEFSTRAFCASFKPRPSRNLSVIQRITPPIKMANVVPNGRYMPTAKSITLFTSIMIIASPSRMPTITNGHAMSPPTIPLDSMAINPACGAGSAGLPKWYALSRIATGKKRTSDATTMPKRSPICIFEGVPPRMYPTFRSCSISPATADETHTTAATPSTAATPPVPDTPSATMSRAAITSVHSVRPDTGLFDDPIIPTRLPETAAKKNPTTSMTPAATNEPVSILELESAPAPLIKK